jgi:hypothetical protein
MATDTERGERSCKPYKSTCKIYQGFGYRKTYKRSLEGSPGRWVSFMVEGKGTQRSRGILAAADAHTDIGSLHLLGRII